MFEQQYTEMFSEPFYMDHIDPNLIVFNNEPYTPPETIQDLLNDYLNALNILRAQYLESKDEKLGRLLVDLLPAAIYSKYN